MSAPRSCASGRPQHEGGERPWPGSAPPTRSAERRAGPGCLVAPPAAEPSGRSPLPPLPPSAPEPAAGLGRPREGVQPILVAICGRQTRFTFTAQELAGTKLRQSNQRRSQWPSSPPPSSSSRATPRSGSTSSRTPPRCSPAPKSRRRVPPSAAILHFHRSAPGALRPSSATPVDLQRVRRLAARTLTLPCAVAALLVAAEAVVSDLFALERYRCSAGTFYCGNFGIIVLDRAHAHRVPQLLRSMINVTMMRGAQCAGLVSYTTDRNDNSTAARSRVVNGKRTDLCEKLLSQRRTRAMLGAATRRAPDGGAPLVFQGHTRFATSSIVNLGGCHPHRWSPPSRRTEWRFVVGGGGFAAAPRNVEGYVTHNGDLDFFTMNGVCYSVRNSSAAQFRAQFLRHSPSSLPGRRAAAPPPRLLLAAAVGRRLGLHRRPRRSPAHQRPLVSLRPLRLRLWRAQARGPALDAALRSRAALESLAAIIEREWVVLLRRAQASCTESRRGPPAARRRRRARAHRAAHGRRGHRRRRARPRAKGGGGTTRRRSRRLFSSSSRAVTPLVAAEATRWLGLPMRWRRVRWFATRSPPSPPTTSRRRQWS